MSKGSEIKLQENIANIECFASLHCVVLKKCTIVGILESIFGSFAEDISTLSFQGEREKFAVGAEKSLKGGENGGKVVLFKSVRGKKAGGSVEGERESRKWRLDGIVWSKKGGQEKRGHVQKKKKSKSTIRETAFLSV